MQARCCKTLMNMNGIHESDKLEKRMSMDKSTFVSWLMLLTAVCMYLETQTDEEQLF